MISMPPNAARTRPRSQSVELCAALSDRRVDGANWVHVVAMAHGHLEHVAILAHGHAWTGFAVHPPSTGTAACPYERSARARPFRGTRRAAFIAASFRT